VQSLFADHWVLLALLSAAVFSMAFLVSAEALVARRVYRDFVFLIALPLIVLAGWALFGLAAVTDFPVAIWQGLIAGLVIASGWLTAAIFNELGRARVKSERLRDYHKAIYAEIGTALSALWDSGQSDAHVANIVARMEENGDFVPFIPREQHDHIYNAVVGTIDVLPRQTIDAIVAYYSLTKALAALADDMRGDRFQTLGQLRRIAMYSDYAAMRREAFAFGQFALQLIKAYSEDGPAAADTLINSRGAGRSAPSPGSE
jgi:hypothetical protein